MSGRESTNLFDPLSLYLSFHPHRHSSIRQKEGNKFSWNICNISSRRHCQAQYVSRSIYWPIYHPPFCSPSSSFLNDVILSPFPFHSISSVDPLWRGPVMSAPTSDEPSPSLHCFYRTKGSRKRRPWTLLCTADRSLSGGQVRSTEGIWCGCLLAERQGRDSLPRIERQQMGHFYRARSRVMWRGVECTLTFSHMHALSES